MWLVALLLILVAIMVAAYKKRIATVQNINQGVSIFDDFIENLYSGDALKYSGDFFESSYTGSGQVLWGVNPTFNYPGCVQLYIQANSDKAVLKTRPAFSLQYNSFIDTQTRVSLNNLSSGSSTYLTRFGFSDNILIPGSETTSAVIYYDSTVSNNFICAVTNTNGTTQSITSTTVAANTDYYLRILVTPNFTYFYVNNVLVATIQASPDTTTYLECGWYRGKTAGASSSVFYVDGISIVQKFTTPRLFINPQ